MLNPRPQVYWCDICRCMHVTGEKHTSNKYHAKRVHADGYSFDSQAEYRRYQELRERLQRGEITDLVVHPRYELIVNGVKIARYTADFRYSVDGVEVVEDVKSEPTRKKRDYQLTRKLMLAVHGIRIIEIV